MDLDPYLVLGVPRNCTYQQAKRTVRASVRRHHPDRGGDEQKFIRICAAYKQILADLEHPVDTATTVRVVHEDFRALLLRVSARSDPPKTGSRPIKSMTNAPAAQGGSGAVIAVIFALAILIFELLLASLSSRAPLLVPAAPVPAKEVFRHVATRVQNEGRESRQALARTPFRLIRDRPREIPTRKPAV